jgi:hypothetical protein
MEGSCRDLVGYKVLSRHLLEEAEEVNEESVRIAGL